MAIFHHSIKLISRGKGKSAVASSAYRSGTKITNEYDGVTHDYTHKGGIHSSAILLPPHAPKEYADRSILWNAVEMIEKQHNAQLAREIEVSIPKEIPSYLWRRMMIDFCNSNFVKQGMIADLSIHNKDPNNPHCHIMLTMRPIKENGKWGAKSRKEYILDDSGNRIKLPSGNWKSTKVDTMDWNSQDNAEVWRANWSEHCNLYLENLGCEERIDHRSYERQGIDQIPSIHLGVSASQMEQKGIETDRGNINRQIHDDNKEVKIIKARITRLMKWQRELKAQPLDLEKADVKASVLGKLQANNVVVNNQYQTIKSLKANTSAWYFIQTHNIESMHDFANKISDLNASFYTIKKERIAIKKKMESIDKRLELWSEYQKVVPIKKKYQKLQGKDKEQFYDKHQIEIERVDELGKVWAKFSNGSRKINVSDWTKERTSLEQDMSLCEWKLKALKTEIGRAEKVKQILEEQRIEIVEPRKIKDRDVII
ncbi:MobQ family relaxase [Chakrabartyella piscis]|uniref:MobQ family relaxase n=1 Tax=Chakrabartyella piscis TaxID=2918914 RepID=UPI00295837C3|nr:MobQ family relaxase [Chakrabartyella piscis]